MSDFNGTWANLVFHARGTRSSTSLAKWMIRCCHRRRIAPFLTHLPLLHCASTAGFAAAPPLVKRSSRVAQFSSGGMATTAVSEHNRLSQQRNSATGWSALQANSLGSYNTARGGEALQSNSTGSNNIASGFRAMFANTTGMRNVAVGSGALKENATGRDNIALGNNAGAISVIGVNNIHIGHAGVVGETKVIRLGRQSRQLRVFIAGIRGAPVSGAVVVVSTTGQLGVVSSSRRYKQNIKSMVDASAALMNLKPVTVRYKGAYEQGQRPVPERSHILVTELVR